MVIYIIRCIQTKTFNFKIANILATEVQIVFKVSFKYKAF